MANPNFMIATCGQSNDTCPDVKPKYTRWREGVKQWGYSGSPAWEQGADPMTLEADRGASYRGNLSHYLRGKYTGLELGICTSGVSGTGLNPTWVNPASAEYVAFKARTLAAAAAAGLALSATNFIVLFIGMESDVVAGRTANEIEADMNTFVAQMRSDFSVPTLKVFFTAPYDSTRAAATAVVKTGIEQAEAGDANIHLMADLADYDHIDTVHISQVGNDALGLAEGVYIDAKVDFSSYLNPIATSSEYLSAQYSDETSYMLVNIDNSQIPSNQTFVPLVISEAHLPPRFWSGMDSATGNDVVFTDTAGTKFEIEKVDIDQSAETMTVWFRASALLAAIDSQFLIQFGSSTVNETSSVNTWKSCYGGSTDYLRAFHCEEASGNLADSLGNADAVATNGAYEAVMKINNGVTFNGIDTTFDMGVIPELSNIQKFTILSWVKQTTVFADDYFFSMTPGGSDGVWLYTSSTGTGLLYFSIWDGALGRISVPYVDEGITNGQLFMLGAVFDGTLSAANRAKLYFDAVLKASTPTDIPTKTPTFSSGSALIGRAGTTSLNGDQDEFRIILGALTQDQMTIHKSNESQFDTNNIFAFGDVKAFGTTSGAASRRRRYYLIS